MAVGLDVGCAVGFRDGDTVGALVGFREGVDVGRTVGRAVGFPGRAQNVHNPSDETWFVHNSHG